MLIKKSIFVFLVIKLFHVTSGVKTWSSCDLTVKDEYASDINDYFDTAEFKTEIQNCNNIMTLTIDNLLSQSSAMYILEKDWLKYGEIIFQMTTLTIKSSNIYEIMEDAFVGELFATITKLYLNKITPNSYIFRRGMLNGLNKVQELYIQNQKIEDFEEDFLDSVQTTLTLIRISGTNNIIRSSSLKKLFSTTVLGTGSTIDMRSSVIPHIESGTFEGQINVRSLVIISINGGITFDKDILYPLKSLVSVNLRSNGLESLPKGIFEEHMRNRDLRVYLQGNNWICDCRIKHFMTAYNTAISVGNSNLFTDPIICDSPLQFNGKNLVTDDVDYCPADTENQPEEQLVELQCSGADSTNLKETAVAVPMNRINFEIQQVSDTSIDVKLDNDSITDGLVLLWFNENFEISNTKSMDQMSCASELKPTVRVDGLTKDALYTFCVTTSVNEELYVSPFNCLMHDSTVETKDNTNEKESTPVENCVDFNLALALLITIPLIAFILGVVIMYCYVRKRLIKGIILEHERQLSEFRKENDKRLSTRPLPDVASIISEEPDESPSKSIDYSDRLKNIEPEVDLYLSPLPPPYWKCEKTVEKTAGKTLNEKEETATTSNIPTVYMEFPNSDIDNIYEYIEQERGH